MSDPIAFHIWNIPVRWYSLAYILSFVSALIYIKYTDKKFGLKFTNKFYDDCFVYITVCTIFGGRIGYVLLYNLRYYLSNPAEILYIWHGGMSFHGGITGVMLAALLVTKKHKVSYLKFLDIIAPAAAFGLFLGRTANFINGELYGKITDVPWSVMFAQGGLLPRHPTQIYEAILEGLIPSAILHILLTQTKTEGVVAGCFAIIYAITRITVEVFREPDPQIGYILQYFTAGQLLCVPLIIIGSLLLIRGVCQNTKIT